MKTFIQAIANLVGVDISEPGNKKIFVRIIFIAAQFIVLMLLLAIYLWSFQKDGTFGQIGDFFNGILGPFLSLITILLVYATYRVQKEELKATLEELRKTAESMQDQKKIMEMQEETQRQMRCDSVMKHMFDTYRSSWSTFLAKEIKELFFNSIKEYLKKINVSQEEFKKEPQKYIQGVSMYFLDDFKNSLNYENYKRVMYLLISAFTAPSFCGVTNEQYLTHKRFFFNNQLGILERIISDCIFLLNVEDLSSAYESMKQVTHKPSKEILQMDIKEYLLRAF